MPAPWRILLIDDDPAVHARLKLSLPAAAFTLTPCYTACEALLIIENEAPDLILCEIDMPDMNAIQILTQTDILKQTDMLKTRPPFIVTSKKSEAPCIVDAIKAGADEFLLKPFEENLLLETLNKYLSPEKRRLPKDLPYSEEGAVKDQEESRLVGDSRGIRGIRKEIRAFAENDAIVLITGESGTGKEVVAQELHEHSPRAGGPFRPVNCGALPEALFESEMFGSEKGAFTGALTRTGFFESSRGGTLFLDEIGELSLLMQVKLLRVIEDKCITRLGSNASLPVDVRIIAATNRDLRESIAAGRFREDLFYRLNILRIIIPPLRERPEDIPILSYTFLREFAQNGPHKKFLSSSAVCKLTAHTWPGNVRELRNVLQRAFFISGPEKIQPEDITF